MNALAAADDFANARCRICHAPVGELLANKDATVIAPCLCSRENKWVHRKCLNELIEQQDEEMGADFEVIPYYRCLDCK